MWFHAGKLKIDAPGRTYMIDMNVGVFTFLNHQDKSYGTATVDEIIIFQQRLLKAMKDQAERLKGRAKTQAMAQIKKLETSAKNPQKPSIHHTKQTESVGGHRCKIVTWKDGFGKNQACIADQLPVNVAPFLKAYAQIGERLRKGGASNAAPTQALFMLPGFPLRTQRTIERPQGPLITTSVIQDLRSFQPTDTTFRVPAGYQKRSLERMLQQ